MSKKCVHDEIVRVCDKVVGEKAGGKVLCERVACDKVTARASARVVCESRYFR